jgi:hypothetical protein
MYICIYIYDIYIYIHICAHARMYACIMHLCGSARVHIMTSKVALVVIVVQHMIAMAGV